MSKPTRPPDSPAGRNLAGQGKPTPPRPLVQRLWWLAMALILGWNLYAFLIPKAPPAVVLSYSAFLEQVRADNVASVALAGQNADGAFKNAIVQPPEVGAAEPAPAPTAAQPPAADAAPTTYTRFTAVIPVTGDDRLLPLLEQHGVSITAKDTTGGSWLLDLAATLLPMALLVGVLFFMARQSQRGAQSLFSFGGSKARVYNQEKPGITFADVAGQ
ncbi:MAG: ATP-dependent metallopeptidase FtsH/Yme1/Tma family protein, partial [Chloroflexota bacterium]